MDSPNNNMDFNNIRFEDEWEKERRKFFALDDEELEPLNEELFMLLGSPKSPFRESQEETQSQPPPALTDTERAKDLESKLENQKKTSENYKKLVLATHTELLKFKNKANMLDTQLTEKSKMLDEEIRKRETTLKEMEILKSERFFFFGLFSVGVIIAAVGVGFFNLK